MSRNDVSPIERIASLHYARPIPVMEAAAPYGVFYTVEGSADVFRIMVHNTPKAWKTRAGAEKWAGRSLAADSALSRSLGVSAVFVGTADEPARWPVSRKAAERPRCMDCGEVGERTGHMGCQYPQNHG